MSILGKGMELKAVEYLQDGYWKSAIDILLTHDLDYKEIMDWCDRRNFYPNDEFKNYIHAQTNKEALNDFFSKVNI